MPSWLFFCRRPFAQRHILANQEATQVDRRHPRRAVDLARASRCGGRVGSLIGAVGRHGSGRVGAARWLGRDRAERLFGCAAHRSRCGNDANALLQSARIGVFGKAVLTALLFGVIFATVRPISGPAVFAGFIAAQVVVPAALLIGGGTTRLDTGEKS